MVCQHPRCLCGALVPLTLHEGVLHLISCLAAMAEHLDAPIPELSQSQGSKAFVPSVLTVLIHGARQWEIGRVEAPGSCASSSVGGWHWALGLGSHGRGLCSSFPTCCLVQLTGAGNMGGWEPHGCQPGCAAGRGNRAYHPHGPSPSCAGWGRGRAGVRASATHHCCWPPATSGGIKAGERGCSGLSGVASCWAGLGILWQSAGRLAGVPPAFWSRPVHTPSYPP